MNVRLSRNALIAATYTEYCAVACPDLDAPPSHPPAVYDLIANITHESAAGTTRDKESTVWKVQLRAGSGGGDNEQWFQIQDLIVDEIRKEMIVLGETALQVSSLTMFQLSEAQDANGLTDLGA